MLSDNLKFKAGLALSAVFVVVALAAPGSASAKCVTGGLTPAAVDVCTPTAKAKLLPTGELIPPKSAPPRVVAVIEAANKIRTKPYIYGGGHARWWDTATTAPAPSASRCAAANSSKARCPRARWPSGALAGLGRWITVYTNPGHAYAVIAGVRWDTSGNEGETGPRWHTDLRDNIGFVSRHPTGY